MRKKSGVYTRTGDSGTCQLIGGSRVPKDDPRVECYGTVDEGCALVGLLRVRLGPDHSWQSRLQILQRDLMALMTVLASPPAFQEDYPFDPTRTGELEEWIDEMEADLAGSSKSFLLPGGCETSALCHLIRTVFRRAERRMAALHRIEPVPAAALAFGNRLSDFFFLFARFELHQAQVPEEPWKNFR